MVAAGLLAPLIAAMTDAAVRVRREAHAAVANVAADGRAEEVRRLVELGAVPALCRALREAEAEAVVALLEGLQRILEVRAGRLAGCAGAGAEKGVECDGR